MVIHIQNQGLPLRQRIDAQQVLWIEVHAVILAKMQVRLNEHHVISRCYDGTWGITVCRVYGPVKVTIIGIHYRTLRITYIKAVRLLNYLVIIYSVLLFAA